MDAKLARIDAKPGHILQLCFYADAIEQMTGRRPRRMHLWLGSGRLETLDVAAFAPYWRRIRTQLASVLASDDEGGPHDAGAVWSLRVLRVRGGLYRAVAFGDSLIYVAGLREPPIANS